MSTASPITTVVREAIEAPGRDVVRLVDDLLALCREHGLTVNCRPDLCRVGSADEEWEEVVEQPFRRAVFRAVLARLAAISNEQQPGSVTPYQGRGTITRGDATIELSFANTPDEQWLKLRPGS